MSVDPVRDAPRHPAWTPEIVEPSPPGQMAIVMAGLAIGVLLLGIQLWLLTVALDLYLAGRGGQVWALALVSGAIFLGGLLILWLLGRRPKVRRSPTRANPH